MDSEDLSRIRSIITEITNRQLIYTAIRESDVNIEAEMLRKFFVQRGVPENGKKEND